MNIQKFLNQFNFVKSQYDDGSGFWDSYEGKVSRLGTNARIDIATTSEALQKVFAVRAIVFVKEQNALLARRAFISIENISNTKSQYAVGV